MRLTRTAIAAAALAAVLAAPSISRAFDGIVVDLAGKPLPGSRVCYVLLGADGLCAETDDQGRFGLPDSEVAQIRTFHSGFLPDVRTTPKETARIVLEHAAALTARLRDAVTGQPIASGEISVIYLSGRSRGPLPCNAAGVHVKTLWPGEVRVVGSAEGYRHDKPPTVELVANEDTEVVLDLTPVKRDGD